MNAYYTRRINDNYDLKFMIVLKYSKIGYCYPEAWVEGINQHSGLVTRLGVDLTTIHAFKIEPDDFYDTYEDAELLNTKVFEELNLFHTSLIETLDVFEQVIVEEEDECND